MNRLKPSLFTRLWLWVSFAVLTMGKLWLVRAQNLYASCDAVYDDRLFFNLATYLLNGHWLGIYNQLTLAKGIFYPLWVAAAHSLCLPLLMSQHLLYVFACLVFVVAIHPIIRQSPVLLLLYGVLLFNPMSYAKGVMPVFLREGIYAALTLLFVGAAIGLLVRYRQSTMRLSLWATGLGFAFSAFWLTREEGVWILPFLFFIIGCITVKIWKASRWNRQKYLPCLLPVVVWIACLGTVAGINKVHYGIFTTAEMNSRDFRAAYGALCRVTHAKWQRAVPCPKETRERIYKASPAFAELRQVLETDIDTRWGGLLRSYRERYGKNREFTKSVEMFLNSYGSDDIWVRIWNSDNLFSGEIHGGWFIWAFRDAVAATGYYLSGASASAYYRRLSGEINAACREGKLLCGPERASLMSPWHDGDTILFMKTFVKSVSFLVGFRNFSAEAGVSEGSEESVRLFEDRSQERLFPLLMTLRGWAFSPGKEISFSLSGKDGDPREAHILANQDSEDVYRHFITRGLNTPNARYSRFEVTSYCPSDCYLDIKSAANVMRKIPLDGSVSSMDSPDLKLYIDSITYTNTTAFGAGMDALRIKILESIGRGYQFAAPFISVAGLILYVACTVRILRRRIMPRIWVVNTGLLVAISSRLLIVSLIHVTSFPGISARYLSPAYPLLLIFIILVFELSQKKESFEKEKNE